MSSTDCRVFISLRLSEASTEAVQLKTALEERGVPTFLCAVPEGQNIKRQIVQAIDACEMVVVMGTETYGVKTATPFATHEEMEFIFNENKPFFLVKMCDRFQDPMTRFNMPKSVSYYPWQPGTPMPSHLPGRIIDRLEGLSRSDSIESDSHGRADPTFPVSSQDIATMHAALPADQAPATTSSIHVNALSSRAAVQLSSAGCHSPFSLESEIGHAATTAQLSKPKTGALEAGKAIDAIPSNLSLSDLDEGATREKIRSLFDGSCGARLNLSRCSIGDREAIVLSKPLKTNSTLTWLFLYDNSVGPTGAAALGKALETNNTLQQLSLFDNSIEDSGAAALGKALETNSSLQTLDLYNNSITESGGEALCRALQSNSTLHKLNLERNSIGDSATAALGKALEGKNGLKWLKLRDNSIGPSGIVALAKALETNSSLQDLDLGRNSIDERGIAALCKALETNSSLQELNLLGRYIPLKIKQPLRDIAKRRAGKLTVNC